MNLNFPGIWRCIGFSWKKREPKTRIRQIRLMQNERTKRRTLQRVMWFSSKLQSTNAFAHSLTACYLCYYIHLILRDDAHGGNEGFSSLCLAVMSCC